MFNNVFTVSSLFWLLAGVLIGIASTVAFGRLWNRNQASANRSHNIAWAGASVIAMVVTSLLLYGWLGRPDSLPGASAVQPPGAASASDTQSMEAVTARLAERLARDGGADSDWELLAQSYEFMGRADDAARARAHNAAIAPIKATQTTDAAAWIAKANADRLQRNYAGARAAFEAAIALNGMTADSWADYADVLASAQPGPTKLSGAPAQAIDKALALAPNHAKALWLKASHANEEGRYVDALALWKRLRTVIGDNKADAELVDANIAEAQQLAAGSAMKQSAKQSSQQPIVSTQLTGTVEIDPQLRARVARGATLFVYAKAVDSPGPPLAVFRTAVNEWPIHFNLDDSMAMMPSRNLSSAKSVIVEARISQTGEATASAGDLQASGVRVTVRDGKSIRLSIDKVTS